MSTTTSRQDSIRITQKQAKILEVLIGLPSMPTEKEITHLALQDPNFCDRIMSILFPRRRPPSITPAIIHQCVRSIGVERVSRLFVCNSIFNAFANINFSGFSLDTFWLDSLRRAFAAQTVAESLEQKDIYTAFVSGFLAEIGVLLLASRYPHLSTNLYSLRNRISDHRIEIERLLTGFNHCEEITKSGFSKLIPQHLLQAICTPYQIHTKNDEISLSTILHTAAAIADLGQAYPKADAIAIAEDNAKTFQKELNIADLFNAAETQSNSLAQDLGIDVPIPIDYSTLCNPVQSIQQKDNFLATPFPLSSERQLEDRGQFQERIEQFFSENHTDFSVLLINIDNFSKINTSYGYPTGDNILRRLSQQIAGSMRTADFVAHLGSDQFAILLPQTQSTGAKVAAERIRSMVKNGNLSMGSIRIISTVSIGGATIDKNQQIHTIEQLWSSLESALQEAKNKGKNKVIWAL